jgi:hypothetical protein
MQQKMLGFVFAGLKKVLSLLITDISEKYVLIVGQVLPSNHQ